jgi:hypothetical protein
MELRPIDAVCHVPFYRLFQTLPEIRFGLESEFLESPRSIQRAPVLAVGLVGIRHEFVQIDLMQLAFL